MVSVFEGQLTRTWYYNIDSRRHVLCLYHDTITGMRSCAVDFEEVSGSLGNSSVMMDSAGHRMFFNVGDFHGYFSIIRQGWTGFEYACVVNDVALVETTMEVSKSQDPQYKTNVIDVVFVPDWI